MDQNPLAQAAKIMEETRDKVLAVLTSEHSMMALKFKTNFDSMICSEVRTARTLSLVSSMILAACARGFWSMTICFYKYRL